MGSREYRFCRDLPDGGPPAVDMRAALEGPGIAERPADFYSVVGHHYTLKDRPTAQTGAVVEGER